MSSPGRGGGYGRGRGRGGRGGGGGFRRPGEDGDAIRRSIQTPEIRSAFAGFQSELDARHDRHERVVKLSRDVTIEAKRIIFLIHRATADRENVLKAVWGRLEDVRMSLLVELGLELVGQDPHLFLRAYSPGLQEYIEALAFYYYIAESRIIPHHEVQELLTFLKPTKAEGESASTEESSSPGEGDGDEDTADGPQPIPERMRVTVPYYDYMLGIADIGGELMRYAINCIPSGEFEAPKSVGTTLRDLVSIFDLCLKYFGGGYAGKEYNNKITVLRSSQEKVEKALYALNLRGSEVPRELLASLFSKAATETSLGLEMEGV